MSITAKELAAKLQLSPAAVSLALNGKPGVSAAVFYGTDRRHRGLLQRGGFSAPDPVYLRGR